MSWPLRMAPVPLRPSVLASCFSSGRTMLSSPVPLRLRPRGPSGGARHFGDVGQCVFLSTPGGDRQTAPGDGAGVPFTPPAWLLLDQVLIRREDWHCDMGDVDADGGPRRASTSAQSGQLLGGPPCEFSSSRGTTARLTKKRLAPKPPIPAYRVLLGGAGLAEIGYCQHAGSPIAPAGGGNRGPDGGQGGQLVGSAEISTAGPAPLIIAAKPCARSAVMSWYDRGIDRFAVVLVQPVSGGIVQPLGLGASACTSSPARPELAAASVVRHGVGSSLRAAFVADRKSGTSTATPTAGSSRPWATVSVPRSFVRQHEAAVDRGRDVVGMALDGGGVAQQPVRGPAPPRQVRPRPPVQPRSPPRTSRGRGHAESCCDPTTAARPLARPGRPARPVPTG